jgi:hypothetical protein
MAKRAPGKKPKNAGAWAGRSVGRWGRQAASRALAKLEKRIRQHSTTVCCEVGAKVECNDEREKTKEKRRRSNIDEAEESRGRGRGPPGGRRREGLSSPWIQQQWCRRSAAGTTGGRRGPARAPCTRMWCGDCSQREATNALGQRWKAPRGGEALRKSDGLAEEGSIGAGRA